MKKYIKANHLYRYIVASKADQQMFIDKFGKDSFDDFQKLKQRIKNKGYSADLTYHIKNTSVEDMYDILDSVSDTAREKEVDIDGRQIPAETGNYYTIAEDGEWTIYQPLDYVESIYCAHGGRWCTAGGYMIPEGKVKVSQAAQYFNEYTDDGIELYYCINNSNVKESIAVAYEPETGKFQYFNYRDAEIELSRIPQNLIDLLVELGLAPPEFDIDDDGVLVKYNWATKDVVIPNGVTSIGDRAFNWCSNLTSVTIPNSVTRIDDGAFYDCTSLKSVTIPNSVTSIGIEAFYYCRELKSVTIPDGVTSIEPRVFYGCESLTSISIPDSVTNIGAGAFSSCESLIGIDIPDSVERIGRGAFSLCFSLTRITIPDSVTSIDDNAFYDCTSLTVYTKNPYVINYCKDYGIPYEII